jgi:SulP family sulfate permease
VKRRLEKLGIAGLIPGNHWMGDRLTALKEGLSMVREKESVSYNELQQPFSPISDS